MTIHVYGYTAGVRVSDNMTVHVYGWRKTFAHLIAADSVNLKALANEF